MDKVYVIDCETLSLRDNAVILSIGLTHVTPDDENITFSDLIKRGLYVKLDRDEQIAKNRDISESTLSWWNMQDGFAKEVFSNDCLLSFSEYSQLLFNYFKDTGFDGGQNDVVFTRGLIDSRWVDSLFADFNTPGLFPYWCARDVRTALEICTGSANGNIKVPKEFIKHHSLHDASLDALRLFNIFSK